MMKRQLMWCMVGTACCVAPARSQEAAQTMPLREVVLFSSGVGYFGRSGRVSGDGVVELSFPSSQINDILKSLVLFDPQGRVRPVTYSIEDFVARRPLGTDLTVNSAGSLGALLRQFQGTLARLELRGEVIEGRIVSVSTKIVPVKDGSPLQSEAVTILSTSGLRTVSLDDVTQVKLLDQSLDRKLRASLEKLAAGLTSGLDDGKRPVRLHFDGNKVREVRAGYLQEMPVWKTSYRLVLDPKGKPYLQGWALVENTTDDDWKDVRLSLVSGRPISFIQNLYQPLYVPRPVVAAQVIGSPSPQTYAETLDEGAQAGQPPPSLAPSRGRGLRRDAANAPAPGGFGGGGFGGSAAGVMNSGDFDRSSALEARSEMAISAEQLAKATASQATGTERGELFEYAIGQPVSLPKRQAAMVPIVSENIDGEKLSIYDPNSNLTRALNGFRLRNNTGLHLSGGPITVFQNGVYAGDGQINNVQPGETRLISYAVDLDLVANREAPGSRQETLSFSAKSGVLLISRREQRENTYTFRNKSDAVKTVLVQQPIVPEFKLVQPAQADEKSPSEYRFTAKVPAKGSVTLKVLEERPVTESIALVDMNFDALVAYARNAKVSPKLRSALEQLVARRRKITDLQGQRAALEGEIKAIDEEQSRIRQNMDRLERNNPLYLQYVQKLTAQETRIEKLRVEAARLRAAENEAQKELRAFVDNLTAE